MRGFALLTAVLVSAAGVAAAACTIERSDVRTPEGEPPEADSVTVRKVVEATATAFQRGDFAALDSLYHEGVAVFEDGEAFSGWAGYRDERVLPGYESVRELQVDLQAIDVRLVDSTAWVTCSYRIAGTRDGEPVAYRGLSTMILRKTGGRWLIVHVHNSTVAGG
ncbi:MAG TPA: nuclear transport factor 2 family protein [Gemmatimonadota bacterium]|nr:nuclear transport factor 2 family protein [Gemmatimonadota bacterium]